MKYCVYRKKTVLLMGGPDSPVSPVSRNTPVSLDSPVPPDSPVPKK